MELEQAVEHVVSWCSRGRVRGPKINANGLGFQNGSAIWQHLSNLALNFSWLVPFFLNNFINVSKRLRDLTNFSQYDTKFTQFVIATFNYHDSRFNI